MTMPLGLLISWRTLARSSSRTDPIPALEWITAALGLILFLGLLGVLASEALSSADDDVPRLSARIGGVTAIPGGHAVRFSVSNASGQTAAAVQVEGKLGAETASATLDYVPGRSEAKGGLMFKGYPAAGVAIAVLGYELP